MSGRALSCVVGVTTALVTVLRPRAKVARAFAAHFPPVAKALDFPEDRLGSIARTRPESAIAARRRSELPCSSLKFNRGCCGNAPDSVNGAVRRDASRDVRELDGGYGEWLRITDNSTSKGPLVTGKREKRDQTGQSRRVFK